MVPGIGVTIRSVVLVAALLVVEFSVLSRRKVRRYSWDVGRVRGSDSVAEAEDDEELSSSTGAARLTRSSMGSRKRVSTSEIGWWVSR